MIFSQKPASTSQIGLTSFMRRQFRERVKARYLERIGYCKDHLKTLNIALDAMDNLAAQKPYASQMEQDMGLFVGLM